MKIVVEEDGRHVVPPQLFIAELDYRDPDCVEVMFGHDTDPGRLTNVRNDHFAQMYLDRMDVIKILVGYMQLADTAEKRMEEVLEVLTRNEFRRFECPECGYYTCECEKEV